MKSNVSRLQKSISRLKIIILFFTLYNLGIEVKAQFKSERNQEYYNQPYNVPTTSRPADKRYPIPSYKNPGNRFYDQNSNNENYRDRVAHRTDSVRYRDQEYRQNVRGGAPGYGTRIRLNYNQYDNRENLDFEFKNSIFDRWRPDLQGEKRPGEIPGLNLPLAEDVFVSTDSGKVQGFYVYLYDQPGARPDERPANKPLELQRHVLNVTVFLGIPYAQPPYNEGRFKPPRRVLNWHTTWQAIDYSPACPQNLKYVGATQGIRSGIDEDCLYLNIFTPSLSVNARERYAVMFYIHGGDFDHGSGSQFPAHMLSAWGDVVVVTINYRLGALGFLSTADYHSPGNYGLMDMALALEWVYGNIRFFNGDRDRITVFGSGAGGAAAGLLAVLPKTRDWVSQVIGESGSPLAEWAAIDDPYRVQNTSRVFGLEMGCNVENSYNLLHCLVNRDYEELATAPIIPDVGTFPWSPVVDGNFTVPGDSWYEEWNEEDFHILPKLPIEFYKNNEHHLRLRYMTGINRDEAADFVYNDVRLRENNFVVTEDFFNERIKDWVKHYNYTLNPEGAYEAIKWMYTFWPDPHNTTHIREQYIHMISDALYKSGVDEIVKVLINSTEKRSVPTYYYLLNTTVEALKLPLWREVPNNLEYYFITGAPFMDPDFYPERFRIGRQQWTEGDRNISQFMMKTFANFAKWGKPTFEQVEPIKVNWEPTIEGSLKYLSINNTFNTTMHYNYRQAPNTFWYEYMPQVVNEYVPTPPPPRNPWIDMTEPVTATMYALLAVVVAILVILCVCFGLWKSAKRQRNKALDDLSFYSTENLTLTKDEDYEVRNYLEKLSSIRQQNGPSRASTINTMITAGDEITQPSRPVTPSTTAVSLNGKVTSVKQTRDTLSEPDHYSRAPSKKSYSKSENALLNYESLPRRMSMENTLEKRINTENILMNYESLPRRKSAENILEKPIIMELEEPSRVIRGHAEPTQYDEQLNTKRPTVQYSTTLPQNQNYNIGVNKAGYSEQPIGIPELPPYSEAPVDVGTPSIRSASSPAENRKINNLPMYAQPHFHNTQPQPSQNIVEYEPNMYHGYDQRTENVPAGVSTSSPIENRKINNQPMYAQPHFHSTQPQPDKNIGEYDPNVYQSYNQRTDNVPASGVNRAASPTSSTVTFGLSMKPSRSVGTISNASGLILNTDL